jgi:hypothetical protein
LEYYVAASTSLGAIKISAISKFHSELVEYRNMLKSQLVTTDVNKRKARRASRERREEWNESVDGVIVRYITDVSDIVDQKFVDAEYDRDDIRLIVCVSDRVRSNFVWSPGYDTSSYEMTEDQCKRLGIAYPGQCYVQHSYGFLQ